MIPLERLLNGLSSSKKSNFLTNDLMIQWMDASPHRRDSKLANKLDQWLMSTNQKGREEDPLIVQELMNLTREEASLLLAQFQNESFHSYKTQVLPFLFQWLSSEQVSTFLSSQENISILENDSFCDTLDKALQSWSSWIVEHQSCYERIISVTQLPIPDTEKMYRQWLIKWFQVSGLREALIRYFQVRFRRWATYCTDIPTNSDLSWENQWDKSDLESKPDSSIMIDYYIQPLIQTCQSLKRVGVLDSNFVYRVAFQVVRTHVLQQVVEKHAKVFDEPCFSTSWPKWERIAASFGELILSPSLDESERYIPLLNQWTTRMKQYILYAFHDLRCSELFDILIAYPDVSAVLEELQHSLSVTRRDSVLIDKLNQSFQQRLLHMGARTNDILLQYLSLIRVMRQLDPKDVMLQKLITPIRTYLRTRQDAVHAVLDCLLDPDHSDVQQAMRKHATLNPILTSEALRSQSICPLTQKDYLDENWTPLPLDADPDTERIQKADLVDLLLAIFESPQQLINAFQQRLASRLLVHEQYQIDAQIHDLELFKLRFGDALLQSCSIMIKDVTDSKRMNSQLCSSEKVLNATILSRLYWPNATLQSGILPDFIVNEMDAYAKRFSLLKASRYLTWWPQLGQVKLKVTLQSGRVLECRVAPPLAMLLYTFQQRSQWSLTELSEALQETDSELLKKRLHYWIKQGVICEVRPGLYAENTETEESSETVVHEHHEESSSNQQEQQVNHQLYWTFVSNMLTNLGPLPLERIHVMLGMFVPDASLQVLKIVLEQRTQQGHITLTGQVYTLRKG